MQSFIDQLNNHWLLISSFIILARTIDVSLGTVRTICVVRGYRTVSAVLGFFEVVIWLVAISGVLVDINWIKILAFGVGFASGNAVGVWIEQRVALGQQMLWIISKRRAHSVAFALRMAGYAVTELNGRGGRGPVRISVTIVSRKRTNRVIAMAKSVDPEVFVSVEDVRHSSLARQIGSYPRTGWRAVLKLK